MDRAFDNSRKEIESGTDTSLPAMFMSPNNIICIARTMCRRPDIVRIEMLKWAKLVNLAAVDPITDSQTLEFTNDRFIKYVRDIVEIKSPLQYMQTSSQIAPIPKGLITAYDMNNMSLRRNSSKDTLNFDRIVSTKRPNPMKMQKYNQSRRYDRDGGGLERATERGNLIRGYN